MSNIISTVKVRSDRGLESPDLKRAGDLLADLLDDLANRYDAVANAYDPPSKEPRVIMPPHVYLIEMFARDLDRLGQLARAAGLRMNLNIAIDPTLGAGTRHITPVLRSIAKDLRKMCWGPACAAA